MAMPDQLALFLGWLGRASLQASVLIVMIMAARALLRDRLAPGWRHALWLLLVVRLLLPWSPPSRMSVFNLFEGITGRAERVAGGAAAPEASERLMEEAADQQYGVISIAEGNPIDHKSLSDPVEPINRFQLNANRQPGVEARNGSSTHDCESSTANAVADHPLQLPDPVNNATPETPGVGAEEQAMDAAAAASRSTSLGRETRSAAEGGYATLLQPNGWTAAAERSWGWLGWLALAALWLAGCLALLGAAIAQSLALGAAIRTKHPVTDQRTLELLESCKATLGVRAWLAVVEAPGLASPALLGFVRPRLLLPQGAMGELGPDRLRHIFLHELAHLKRRDILMNWVLTALQAVHWFNPLVWLAFRRMREDRELACDALVLSHLGQGEASEYGRTIIALLERFAEPRRLAGLAGILEDKKQIKRRLTMIARFNRHSSLWSAVAALLMLALGGAALTSAQPDEQTNQTTAREDVTIIKHLEAAPGGAPDHVAPEHAAPGARLRIIDFKLEPYPEGGLYSPIISLKNAGDAPTPKYRVKFYRNKAERENPSHNGAGPIEPGGVWNEMMGPIALKEGENRITVEVSPEGSATEADRVRHVAEMAVTIKDGAIVSKRVEIRDAVIMKKAGGRDASAAGSDETQASASQAGAKDGEVRVETFADGGGKRVIITRKRSTGDARMGLGDLATSLSMQLHFDKLRAKMEPAMQEGLKRAAEAQQAIIAQAQKMMELAERVTDESTRQAMLDQARQMQATAQKQLDAFKAQLAQVQAEGQAELQKNLAMIRKRMEAQRSRMGEDQDKVKKAREALDAQMRKSMAELQRARAEMESKSAGVKGGAAGPNPIIRELRIEPAAEPGQFRLIIRIVNEGRETAAPFKVYLVRDADAWRSQGGKIESIKDYWGQVGPMKPGEEKVLEPYPTAIQDGERRIVVLIGPEGKANAEAANQNLAELTVKMESGKIVSRRLTIERTLNDPKSAGEKKSFSYERRIESGSHEEREPAKPGDAPVVPEHTERVIKP